MALRVCVAYYVRSHYREVSVCMHIQGRRTVPGQFVVWLINCVTRPLCVLRI